MQKSIQKSSRAHSRAQQIEGFLMGQGVSTASAMARILGVSQATLSRTLSKMFRVVQIGKGSRSCYALRRELGRWGEIWPVYQVSEQGSARFMGSLSALHAGYFLFEPEQSDLRDSILFAGEFQDGIYPGIPWFLDDMRPQGFLGRLFAQGRGRELRIGENPERWSSDESLIAMLVYGADGPGNWILGTESIEAFQASHTSSFVAEEERSRQYSLLADHIIDGEELPGSSAGGEQPKFPTMVKVGNGEFRPVIIKFSGSMRTESGKRWADLLSLESLASETLLNANFNAMRTEIMQDEERRFLEVERFDRVGRRGRRWVVSLRVLASTFIGEDQSWHKLSKGLEASGWVTAADAQRIRQLHCFGNLIGNADMHSGNLSFMCDGQPPLSLAPVYDMLPMAYAPLGSGDMNSKPLNFSLPRPEYLEDWKAVLPIAIKFWSEAMSLPNLSESMQTIASENYRLISSLSIP